MTSWPKMASWTPPGQKWLCMKHYLLLSGDDVVVYLAGASLGVGEEIPAVSCHQEGELVGALLEEGVLQLTQEVEEKPVKGRVGYVMMYS